jgi:hypothetical protein
MDCASFEAGSQGIRLSWLSKRDEDCEPYRQSAQSKRDGDAFSPRCLCRASATGMRIPPCPPGRPERPRPPPLPTGFASPSRSLVVGVVLVCLVLRRVYAAWDWLFAKSAGDR